MKTSKHHLRSTNEDELHRGEGRFRTLFEQAGVGVALMDTLTGRYVQVNKKFCDILGYTQEEMLNTDFMSITHPDTLKGDLERFDKLRNGEIREFTSEKKYICKNGSVVWVSLSVSATWAPGSPPDYHIAIVQDITGRKLAEEQLHESTERLNFALSGTNDGIWDVNLKTGEVFMSPRGCEILGYSPESFTLAIDQWNDLVHVDDLPATNEALTAYLEGKVPIFRVEQRLKTADGDWRWVLARGKVVANDTNGKPLRMVGTHTDISRRKTAELALQESNERIKVILEHTPIAIWDWNIKDDTWFATPQYFTLLGYEPAAGNLDRTEWLERVHPEDREAIRQKIAGVLDHTSSGYSYDARMLHANGSYRWQTVVGHVIETDADGNATRMVGIRMDITERKAAEKAILESEAQLKKAQRYARMGSWTWNIKTNHLDWSDEMFRIFGLDKDSFTGSLEHVIGQAIHPDDREKVERSNLSVINDRTAVPLEYRIVWPDQSVHVVWAEAGEMILDDAGNPSMLSGTVQDITERKANEDNLRRIEERLRRSEKMEAVGQLAGGIAHDFNNVLGGIIGYTDLSLNYAERGSVLEMNLNNVLKAADRAKHLVKQILAFSRQGNTQKSAIVIRPIVKEVLELLKSSIPSSVIIETDLQGDTKSVLADPTQIHQALLNLATNAVHAMNRKGTLTVRLCPVRLDAAQHGQIGEILPGEYVAIEVADTGCGMDAVTLSKAFEPFYTTKPVGEGTGMGLSVVLGIVQSHGGDIQLQSEVGKGTTIRIFLPVVDDVADGISKPIARVAIAGKEHILFVDDEATLVDMAKNILEPLGFIVTGMTSSLHALKIFEDRADEIDILVTDQTMPGITGIELAKRARAIKPDLPVILCTGFSTEVDTENLADAGIYCLLMKPYRSHEISKAIREVLDRQKG